MPANIAHMLIAHKALQTLKNKGIEEYAKFAKLLGSGGKRNLSAYVNFGSMGPDLYYYKSLKDSAKDMVMEGFVQSTGVTAWAYHLHSCRPNEFCLHMIETLFSDVDRRKGVKLDDDDHRKLAYIAGHLTHIAADQIIHPLVNSVAGPYYRSGKNRGIHRECEVMQDYYLYTDVYRIEEKSGAKYDFFKQEFHEWADCVRGMTTRNTENWFRYFLQRSFFETYSVAPQEDEIENSADNLLITLRVCRAMGPYKKAAKDYENRYEKKSKYKQYVEDVDYIRYYRMAVELASVYLMALYEAYVTLLEGEDFSERHRKRFTNVVRPADLSCPLEKDVLGKAIAGLRRKSSMPSIVTKKTGSLVGRAPLLSKKNIMKLDSEKAVIS